MPPRKGIVKSGNAGNSSKSSREEATDTPKDDGKPPPLFPPGSKYPLSLLQERSDQSPVPRLRARSDNMTSIGAQKMVGKNPPSTLYGSRDIFCDMFVLIHLLAQARRRLGLCRYIDEDCTDQERSGTPICTHGAPSSLHLQIRLGSSTLGCNICSLSRMYTFGLLHITEM